MKRCIDLARLGAGNVAPNPMVGAVLVHGGRIIGEGFHEQYGKAHAEVNAINSVREEDKKLIAESVIYVSLEPCAHFGKTPPCADLIIKHRIPTVVVGCRDPFKEVNGRGIEKLQNAGINVIVGVLEKECKELNTRFFTFHINRRPYIILKWAQSKNQKIANADFSRVLISNEFTNRLVHKWRHEEFAIMVGTRTALYDDPALDVRNWSGRDPIRLVIDLSLRLPGHLQVFNKKQPTIIFNGMKNEEQENLAYYKLDKSFSFVNSLITACYQLQIPSLLIEGGAKLLQSFVDEQMWDEARVIENSLLIIDNGLNAPVLSNHRLTTSENILNDFITYYQNRNTAGM